MSEGTQQRTQEKKPLERRDIPLIVLSVLLLVAMGMATIYGIRYGNVDESVVSGDVSLVEDDHPVLSMHVDDDKHADITYLGLKMSGTLRLNGAEKDTILYMLTKITLEDGAEPGNLAFLVRMPRSGLKGDLAGPWMVYFSRTDTGFISSEWVLANEGGEAIIGHSGSLNPMTTMRDQLIGKSTKGTWEREGSTLRVTGPKMIAPQEFRTLEDFSVTDTE